MAFQASTYPRELSQLQDAGVRVSRQRLQILAYLNQLNGRHLTVEHIFRELSQNPDLKLSVATVYNTINLFVEKGLLRSVEYPGETALYDRRLDPHAHFFCRNCGRIHDLPAPDFTENAWAGYRVEEAQILLTGLCSNCVKQQANGQKMEAAPEGAFVNALMA